MKMLNCLLIVICCAGAAHAQNVTGRVIDAVNHLPLGAASVKVKGSSKGTATDSAGTFTLAAAANAVLVISHIGYTTLEVNANGNLGTIQLSRVANASLEDVVVIGYGTVRKRDLTGSVGKVNVQDLQKAPVKSIDDALAGRVAGVMVTSSDGQPGSNADIVIRGVGSVTQSSAPLYVIDGFPQEDANFNSINPAEVESIEVLKDASATAIYGARGSNGVIIVTTKRGKSAKPVVNYNGYYGIQKPTRLMKMMDPYEYVRLQNDINPYYANLFYFSNGKTLEDYKTAQNIDWQNLSLNSAPAFQNHFISISGRPNKTAYTFSGSYSDQAGLVINSGFKRYQGRFTLDQDLNDKLKVGFNVNYSYVKSYGQIPSVQNVPVGQVVNNGNWNYMLSLWTFRPVATSNSDNSFVYNDLVDDPSEGGVPGGRVNPYISTLNEVNDRFTYTLTANSYLNYKITKDLTLRLTAGINNVNGENDVFHNSKTNSGSPLTSYGATYGVNGSISNTSTTTFVNENTLAYNKKFGAKHLLNAVVGFTQQSTRGKNSGFAATNLPNESLGIKGIGQGTPYTVSSPAPALNGMLSYLGRLNYTFMDNYLFTFSFRADGSSKFAPENRWGYFPSGAVAWRLGNERFMKNLKFINDAKVRASYGATGNNRVSDFPYLTQLTANTSNLSGSYYSFNETNVYNIVVSSMANKNLKWETGLQADIGLDLSLFNDRLQIETDYYKKITKNLLLNASMPYTTGFTSAFVNIGQVSNEGLEFAISTVNLRKKDFTWTTSFNISFNRNRVISLNSGQDALLTTKAFDASVGSIPDYIAKTGQPVAQFYGYIADGNYQLKDFYKVPNGATGYFYVLKEGIPYYGTKSTLSGINTTVSAATSVQPGDPKFKDLNNDGLLDQNDYTVIGHPYPVHFGGISNNFTYKGFDLNVFFQWSYGNDILDANRIKMEGGTSAPQAGSSGTTGNLGNVNTNQYATYANRWTFDNPSDLYPRVNANATGLRAYSTRIVEDGSYLRLKTLQLGYNLPVAIIKKLGLINARFYVSAQNLLTFTHYSGPDPEVSTATGSNLTPGFDYSPYPRTKVMTIGANINF